ncbi:Wzz/FepE/Etk N-terminal domain-containing protein, partial [Staphylococcus aureus]
EPKFPVAHTAGGIHLVEPVVADDTPTIDVRLMFAVLRGNMALIAVIVTAALALALIVTMLQTPRYTAETTVQINDQTQQVLG